MKSALSSRLSRFPRIKGWLKRLQNRFNLSRGVSSHYVLIQADEIEDESSHLRNAWQSGVLPYRQRELVNEQLAAYRRGESIGVFDVMVNALRALSLDGCGMSVLEIGCSSGFYSEVFEIAGLNVHYAGCDYSPSFIELARQTYPGLRFDVEDATALQYQPDAFDIVISGCCLLHIPEYQTAVAETVRVARHYVIFHRTPVVLGQSNQYYRKRAYGVETVEIHFNESHFLDLLTIQGLDLIATYTLDESVKGNVGSANRTYVCRKILP